MEAMLPVEKKADCRRKSVKRDIRASARVRERYWPLDRAFRRVRAAARAGLRGLRSEREGEAAVADPFVAMPFAVEVGGGVEVCT